MYALMKKNIHFQLADEQLTASLGLTVLFKRILSFHFHLMEEQTYSNAAFSFICAQAHVFFNIRRL